MKRDRLEAIVAFAAVLTLVIVSLWVWMSAPCGLWTFAKASDMPARCITE